MRQKLLIKPYDLFLVTALGLFVSSFFSFSQTLDIHLHDTYYVISANYFFWTFALIFFVGWAIYKLTNRFLLTKYLTWVHIILTLIVLAILMTITLWHDLIIPPIKNEAVSFATLTKESRLQTIIALSITTIFIAGQIAYIINLLGGLIKRKR